MKVEDRIEAMFEDFDWDGPNPILEIGPTAFRDLRMEIMSNVCTTSPDLQGYKIEQYILPDGCVTLRINRHLKKEEMRIVDRKGNLLLPNGLKRAIKAAKELRG